MIQRILIVGIACLIAIGCRADSTTKATKKDVQLLYSGSEHTRNQAAERLVAAGPKVVPLVLPVLCDKSRPNFDVAWRVAADVLGRLKAAAAAPCLVSMLMYSYPSIGPVNMKSDETLSAVDPAFKALIEIGDPAVPAINRSLPFLGPNEALMAMRALRVINTWSAKEAIQSYIKYLNEQVRLAREVLDDFGGQPEK